MPAANNKNYVSEFIVNTLTQTFPNISKHQTEFFVSQMFSTCKTDFNAFKVKRKFSILRFEQGGLKLNRLSCEIIWFSCPPSLKTVMS